MTRPALAIDIGGTKLAAGLVAVDGTVLVHDQVPTPGDREATWEVLAGLVAGIVDGPVAGVGIGSAGPVDVPAGTVSPLNIGAWRGFPIVDRVRGLVGDVPVRLAGDGVAATLAEHWLGACRGVDDALVAVISTGVGGGIVSGGRVVTGRTGNAGHVGHVVIDFDGEACVCGGRGCVEAYASGPSMVRHAVAGGWAHPEPDGAALFAALRDGDGAAVRAVDRGAAAIAAMIAGQAAAFDLRLAVLGGGILRAADDLLPRVRAQVDVHARLSFIAGIEVRPAELGPMAGLVGAGRLIHHPESVELDEHSGASS